MPSAAGRKSMEILQLRKFQSSTEGLTCAHKMQRLPQTALSWQQMTIPAKIFQAGYARFMPVQSSINVTRRLSDQDLINQGWASDQMKFDTRQLLHYFRLLTNNRFLFGMRGGLFSTRKENRYIEQLIRRNFNKVFAAWKWHCYGHLFCCFAERFSDGADTVRPMFFSYASGSPKISFRALSPTNFAPNISVEGLAGSLMQRRFERICFGSLNT